MTDSLSTTSPSLQRLKPGAQIEGGGVRFTVFSRDAARLWLMLFDRPDAARPAAEFELDPAAHRHGNLWSIHLPGLGAGTLYAFRAAGPGRFLDPEQWLMDPCARAVETGRTWGDTRGLEPGRRIRSGAAFPKSVVVEDTFDWGDDRPPDHNLEDLVIYECHLRGYTAHPSAVVRWPGTYRGLIEKIPHFQRLGINAVELLPIHEFNEAELFLEGQARKHLLNFWGYNPLAFFAPMSHYATDGSGRTATRELRELIRALHAAGIEIILDVVFNHTGEYGHDGPVYSFKAFGERTYYLVRPDGTFDNFSGCGNTVHAQAPVVQEMIVDCLRHWHESYRVDGFRFDLASVLTRGSDGHPAERPPLLDRIDAEPALDRAKLFAEPWDAHGLYQVGSFPHPRWAEWNGLYRDDVRRFWNGHPGLLGRLATRIAGSSDLYASSGTPLRSINLITTHDGFTLADLVRYREKHNEANAEGNRDGDNHNFSENYGVEGPSDNEAIEATRLRQQKNLLATLFISQGIPLMLGGDEFGRTQGGNNNAYCQDNEIAWVDWTLAEKNAGLLAFVRRLIEFRRTQGSLRRTRFFTGRPGAPGLLPDIVWYGHNTLPPDWQNGRALSFRIDGAAANTGLAEDGPDLFFTINGLRDPVRFHLPPARNGDAWRLEWSTASGLPDLLQPGDVVRAPGLSVSAFSFAHPPPFFS